MRDVGCVSQSTNKPAFTPDMGIPHIAAAQGVDPKTLLDVLIVGGGPAGLSAALVLGRCRRRVLVCDAGHPRNEASHALHGFLTRDGIPPAEFLRIGREQLAQYETVEVREAYVEEVERREHLFTATLRGGERVSARMLLLATGLVDELPKVEGLRQFYGASVHTCPYCDGWEHRDEPLAVLGADHHAAELALELLQWSRDTVLCTHGEPRFDGELRQKLARHGVRLFPQPIAALEGTGQVLEQIRFVDGTLLARRAVFFYPSQHQRSRFAEKLGCTFCDEDGCIQCGEYAETNIPGLYAAGNASRGLQLVIAAAAEGTHAAFAINNALMEVDTFEA
jgi:thioredoxin reductase